MYDNNQIKNKMELWKKITKDIQIIADKYESIIKKINAELILLKDEFRRVRNSMEMYAEDDRIYVGDEQISRKKKIDQLEEEKRIYENFVSSPFLYFIQTDKQSFYISRFLFDQDLNIITFDSDLCHLIYVSPGSFYCGKYSKVTHTLISKTELLIKGGKLKSLRYLDKDKYYYVDSKKTLEIPINNDLLINKNDINCKLDCSLKTVRVENILMIVNFIQQRIKELDNNSNNFVIIYPFVSYIKKFQSLFSKEINNKECITFSSLSELKNERFDYTFILGTDEDIYWDKKRLDIIMPLIKNTNKTAFLFYKNILPVLAYNIKE